MELQDTPFIKFMVSSWIKYERFKGASKICAIFLNFCLLLLKLLFCGVGLLIMVPHIAANHILSKETKSIPQKMLYVLLVVISFVLDIPLLLITLIGIIGCAEFIPRIFTNILMIIPTAVFGGIALLTGKFLMLLMSSLFSKRVPEYTTDESEIVEEEEDFTEQLDIDYDEEDELAFCQLFTIGEEMCLFIHHVEMCPDETAFIRVVGEDSYTPLYKRKVRRDKAKNRYIVFNGTNYYLDDKKTQPVITKL